MPHPSSPIFGTEGKELEGKTIVHCITSSISCFLAPQISRLLMRHGAHVIPVMTPEAAKFIHPMLFEWATTLPPILSIEGKVEHVDLAGLSADKVDLILIAPITANSLSKIAVGIMDNPVTLIAGTALGNKIPTIIVPTMHEVMIYNPAVIENLKKLEQMGVKIIMPKVEEEKAKIPENEEILDQCIRSLYKNDLKDKKILVNAGATRAFLDGIRFISNPSTGKMGFALAHEAWKRGGEVKVVYGATPKDPPKVLSNRKKTVKPRAMYDEMVNSVTNEQYDIVILAAAMNDFEALEQLDEKIKSNKEKLEIVLKPFPKLADKIKELSPQSILVLFKAEYKKTDEELVKIAQDRMKTAQADYIVANEVSTEQYGFESDKNKVALINKEGRISWIEGKKTEIAQKLLDEILAHSFTLNT